MSNTTLQSSSDALNEVECWFYVLKNCNNVQVTITNYGARITSICIPQQDNFVNVVTGFSSIDEYINATAPYYGATIGRYANRIAKGQFSLNGKTYTLPVNNGPNTLHGGNGFYDKVWETGEVTENSIALSYHSADGEEGFPGNVDVKVVFELDDDNQLHIHYEAETDADTVINLTNHAYFNLNGVGSGLITSHMMEIDAEYFTPVNKTQIPTGEIAAVRATPFDFIEPATIGERINNDDEQLKIGNGYDHNYVLDKTSEGALDFAAKVTGDLTGISMEVYTTEPGMQFYSGNFMNGTNVFKGGSKDDFRTAFALETQHFPDSPNQPAFPTTVLKPGEVFKSQTIYKFSF